MSFCFNKITQMWLQISVTLFGSLNRLNTTVQACNARTTQLYGCIEGFLRVWLEGACQQGNFSHVSISGRVGRICSALTSPNTSNYTVGGT